MFDLPHILAAVLLLDGGLGAHLERGHAGRVGEVTAEQWNVGAQEKDKASATLLTRSATCLGPRPTDPP